MIRFWVGLLSAVLLLVGGWLGYREAYRTGWEAAGATIRAEWAVDRARQETSHQQALARRNQAAREVEDGLTAKLAAADARGRDLARRLRNALSRGPAAGAGGCPAAGPADEPAGEPGGGRAIEDALAGFTSACARDAQRLSELQDWVRGGFPSPGR